jgi:CheY-like chemotaxis protein
MDLRRARVLLTEDNKASASIISQVLVGCGIRLKSQCCSADEARGILKIETFDLILLDGEMPGEDGFELTRYIRSDIKALNCTAPIVIFSGYTSKDKVQKARDVGANIVITKPIVPRVFLERIEWVARNARKFVECPSYMGPDRRHHNHPIPEGLTERRGDALKILSAPERSLSQNDIDSLFD